MASWVDNQEKQKYLRDYFASINNIALKFIESKEYVQRQHKEKWNTLSAKEKEEAIDEYIIPTAVKEKYVSIKTPLDVHDTSEVSSVFPALHIETGQREVTMMCNSNDDSDNEKSDNEISWKDEHSEPFSWETRSQMNMALPPLAADRKNSVPKEEQKRHSGSLEKQVEEIVLNQSQINVKITEPKLPEEKPVLRLKKSCKNNSNSKILSKSKPVPRANAVVTNENKSKPDTVSELLHGFDSQKFGDQTITITSSIIDGRNEIEVKKFNLEETSPPKPKSQSNADEYSMKEDDDQHLLTNAQPCADSTPSADQSRLSGFDFLDNW